MTIVQKTLMAVLTLGISLILILAPGAQLTFAANATNETTITEWQMIWEVPGMELGIEEIIELGDAGEWFMVSADGDYPVVPPNITSAWIRFNLPELSQMRPSMELKNMLAQDVVIFIDSAKVYEVHRNYVYDRNTIMVPLFSAEEGESVYIQLKSQTMRIGMQSPVVIDNHDDMIKSGMRGDITDVVIGSSLVIISSFMLLSVIFLNRAFLPGWVSLFLVMLSIGVMILSYSTFFDKYYPELGNFMYYAFDVASAILIPSLLIFFEKIFGKGPYSLLSKFNRYLLIMMFASLFLMLVSIAWEPFRDIYTSISMLFLGFEVIVGNVILIGSLIYYCKKNYKEAYIMAIGLGSFTLITLVEMLWYFISDELYAMMFWKYGIIFFLASLIIMLVRRIMRNYETALQYSKQLEVFNNELQRSEKIEMISHLAASIAHEVRNPLQVTRGFLQILRDKSTEEKSKNYTKLAIDELDRAAEIITDFLTFAKPDLGEVTRLNLAQELQQIEAILMPFATMQGGVIQLSVEEDLFVKGNTSKFKQALINIIKNSIEALREDGFVLIKANRAQEPNYLMITIKDNGEGIDEQDLKRLGEPYYSKKSKGTGLGLMVTYRIIEAMQGDIVISSKKGVGTEVSLRLPISS
ncbi:ATP-binding protein [Paenibacillus sp. CAU 1782]